MHKLITILLFLFILGCSVFTNKTEYDFLVGKWKCTDSNLPIMEGNYFTFHEDFTYVEKTGTDSYTGEIKDFDENKKTFKLKSDSTGNSKEWEYELDGNSLTLKGKIIILVEVSVKVEYKR